ncbi:MAG: hypothetical protein H0W74_11010 [Sphingosinicella sp.]|nr:hypothetical protein [Sphingosinicella sp.]
MRMKNLAAIAAATSLMLASSAVIAAPAVSKLSLSSIQRASASTDDESAIMDSGFIGVAIVFGAGAAFGALVYSLIKGGSDDEPASP